MSLGKAKEIVYSVIYSVKHATLKMIRSQRYFHKRNPSRSQKRFPSRLISASVEYALHIGLELKPGALSSHCAFS